MAATPDLDTSLDQLEGQLGRTLKEDQGWRLALLTTPEGETIRVSGHFVEADMQASHVTLWGEWSETDRGQLFRVQQIWRGEQEGLGAPSPEAIEAFASEFFRGHHFGPASARDLVEDLGEDAWTALTEQPELLSQHLGDSDKAKELYDLVLEEGIDRVQAVAHLMGLGLSLAYARRVYDNMGSEAVALIDEDPYEMIGVPGIGFATADKMAREGYGIERTDPRRLKALAVSVLEDASSKGHTSLTEEDALAGIQGLDEIQEHNLSAHDVLELALDEGDLMKDMGDIYLPYMLRAERAAADGLARLLLRDHRQLPENFWEDELLAGYTREQQEAIAMGLTSPVVLISGRPGTGKTTVAREIVRLAQKQGLKVHLSATTGKAADKLTESIRDNGVADEGGSENLKQATRRLQTIEPAQTIHSLVGFGQKENQELPPGIVIVDEASMMDLPLLARTLQATGDETSLVFLGDPNQLPPVMAGNSSRDIRDSSVVPTLELTKVHRQDRNTLIAINAERVLRGEMPFFYGDRIGPRKLEEINSYYAGDNLERQQLEENVYFLDAGEPEEGAQQVLRVVERLIEKGMDPIWDMQVYTPMHGREMGTKNLNQILQQHINPDGELLDKTDKRGLKLRVGDPVIQTKNDKEGRGVVNGMRGRVEKRLGGGGVRINFGENGAVDYTPGQIRELSMAYATTVHKGQGQEQPVSVLALHHSEHAVMLDRSLLYVGSTRAQNMLVFVATRKALWMALREEKGENRRTRLAERTQNRVADIRQEVEGPQQELPLGATQKRLEKLFQDTAPNVLAQTTSEEPAGEPSSPGR